MHLAHRAACLLTLAMCGLSAQARETPAADARGSQMRPLHAVQVQPSGNEVPANLLRLSVRFRSSIDGAVISRLALWRADGTAIAEPFLEQELWSPDGRVLTVLLHPGRVKSGLKAHDERGPVLSAGDTVTLALDGQPIKRWSIGALDDAGPITSAWRLAPVRAGSREPMVVTLDAPIDGRDADYLAVADAHGRRVAGRGRLMRGESTWVFTPAESWRAGSYRLVARGTLEDPSGNRLGSRFETSIDLPPRPPEDVVIPFSVTRSGYR